MLQGQIGYAGFATKQILSEDLGDDVVKDGENIVAFGETVRGFISFGKLLSRGR